MQSIVDHEISIQYWLVDDDNLNTPNGVSSFLPLCIRVRTIVYADYEWDRRKATSNRRKHGVRFADAITVFGDEHSITIEDDYPDEERFVNLDMDAFGRILLVVYTYRGEAIRIISARKATPLEQQQYKGEQ